MDLRPVRLDESDDDYILSINIKESEELKGRRFVVAHKSYELMLINVFLIFIFGLFFSKFLFKSLLLRFFCRFFSSGHDYPKRSLNVFSIRLLRDDSPYQFRTTEQAQWRRYSFHRENCKKCALKFVFFLIIIIAPRLKYCL